MEGLKHPAVFGDVRREGAQEKSGAQNMLDKLEGHRVGHQVAQDLPLVEAHIHPLVHATFDLGNVFHQRAFLIFQDLFQLGWTGIFACLSEGLFGRGLVDNALANLGNVARHKTSGMMQ